jgi:hypothetical protein
MRSLIVAALLTLGACATNTPTANNDPTPPGGRDCFLASSVNGYSVVDDHTVRVTVGANRNYLLGTTWNVRDLNWTEVVALHSRGSDWICTGNGLGVEVTGGRPHQTYPITSVTREAPQGS